jgi:hypothetical protein
MVRLRKERTVLNIRIIHLTVRNVPLRRLSNGDGIIKKGEIKILITMIELQKE